MTKRQATVLSDVSLRTNPIFMRTPVCWGLLHTSQCCASSLQPLESIHSFRGPGCKMRGVYGESLGFLDSRLLAKGLLCELWPREVLTTSFLKYKWTVRTSGDHRWDVTSVNSFLCVHWSPFAVMHMRMILHQPTCDLWERVNLLHSEIIFSW